MRTCKDAKAMAKSLRNCLAAKSVLLSHSECLEIVAKQFGCADWNTLSAKLDVESGQIFCSFCGKSKHEVRSLIEGGCRNPAPSQCVFICDECVALSAQVIADTVPSVTKVICASTAL
jgi:hypothetical protein